METLHLVNHVFVPRHGESVLWRASVSARDQLCNNRELRRYAVFVAIALIAFSLFLISQLADYVMRDPSFQIYSVNSAFITVGVLAFCYWIVFWLFKQIGTVRDDLIISEYLFTSQRALSIDPAGKILMEVKGSDIDYTWGDQKEQILYIARKDDPNLQRSLLVEN